jgi:hypothetical protein
MEDDSFKYLGHEKLSELVAELRNKMGSVVVLSDLLKLQKDDKNKEFIEKMLPNAKENFIKSIPLIIRYLREFEEYDLSEKKVK